MKIGMVLSQPLIADQIEAARLAEANGFDSVWATEFFHQNGLVRMTALAAASWISTRSPEAGLFSVWAPALAA
jgi:alkanesulfonate monooxygenase SsuD/methylene tetrahydromethanopterin reductase-like flavin-dependent oxidoreductase (luciferase family)